ncbi:MAG: bifunctional 3,4-dihydroxy-2-butanone-4-phosphate synthase/GTP cyclohydrolase II [Rhodoferax sp.]|nr:bifunctional 3,4-dihydroxy-2-butanone-4-phosphate synthase/GTP cyclohydrolase II [Rhodoferax sp.]
MTTPSPVPISPVEDIVADMRLGRMVILVDEEDRENEGDLILAADHVTPEAINFMARHARGLICLTLTRDMCERLQLPPMVTRNNAKHSTAFTVSIEAAEGVTTGISAADRARTVQVAVARGAKAEDLVQPGHIFPLQAVDGGVLMRAGHTEAGCDLAAMAGCSPASVICEVMKDDGTMARLPDLQLFAAEHGLKIGTIADLIEHRSRVESLIEKVGTRTINTAWGEFTAHAYLDKPSRGLHLALVKGQWRPDDTVVVRVHEPLSVLDALEVNRSMHTWGLDTSLKHIAQLGQGVVVLLNCGESAAQLLAQFEGTARASHGPERGRMDLRTYGIGAQILRECGVHKMNLMGTPRRMPSMVGYGLEIAGYTPKE